MQMGGTLPPLPCVPPVACPDKWVSAWGGGSGTVQDSPIGLLLKQATFTFKKELLFQKPILGD